MAPSPLTQQTSLPEGKTVNAITMAKTAYAASSRTPLKTNRGTEYELFAQITHRMDQHANESTFDFAKLAQALHDNRRLWTLLAADVADEMNGLPAELRARIFYLAEFTADHTRQVLSGDAAASVLVEINTAIMRGLRQTGVSA